MGFDRGAKAIERDEKLQQEARKAAYAADRLDYLTIKEDETVYVRLLTAAEPTVEEPDEGWIKVAQHSFVKTKDAPEDAKNWPKAMGAVCRYDKQIKGILGTTDCYICDKQLKSGFRDEFARPTTRVWALAALRHQVRGDGTPEQLMKLGVSAEEAARDAKKFQGKLLGYDDVREEYEILDDKGNPTGRKAEQIKIVLINMTYSSVFATFASAEENYPGGARGRDFIIRKTGTRPKYEYHVLPAEPVPGLMPGEEGWSRYTDELKRRKIDLAEIVLKQASDEWYARWFDVTKSVTKDGKIVSSGATITETAAEVYTGQYPPRPTDDVPMSAEDQAHLEAMRAKLAQ